MDAVDFVLTQLVQDEEARRYFRRQCKTKTLLRLPGFSSEEYHVIREPFTPKLRAWIRSEYPDAEIINERSDLDEPS